MYFWLSGFYSGENRALSDRSSQNVRTNYTQISALTGQNPVAITVNGKEDTALLRHEDFRVYTDELVAKLAMCSHFAQAMEDVPIAAETDEKNGRAVRNIHLVLLSGPESARSGAFHLPDDPRRPRRKCCRCLHRLQTAAGKANGFPYFHGKYPLLLPVVFVTMEMERKPLSTSALLCRNGGSIPVSVQNIQEV
ncbi:MAG: hypothetical protein J6I98_00745 [Clostridia bacterium]|nr:hypothetical protein [Clostridia bacterium]